MLLTLGEMLARLSKTQRTDRNEVLMALLSMGAVSSETAVGSGDLARHLRSVLRGKTPKNVPDVLIKAGAAVASERSSRGNRSWLTGTGQMLVANALGIDPTPGAPHVGALRGPADRFDVAIVCALPDPEFTSVLRAFGADGWTKHEVTGVDVSHQYQRTAFQTDAGGIHIVAGVSSYMGLTATAILSTQTILLFKPKFILMVGICGGVTDEKRGFGDVLIANPSIDYASGKIRAEGFSPDPQPIPIDAHLSTLFKELSQTREGLDPVCDGWVGAKPNTRLNTHVGPVGTADQVVDSAERIEEVVQRQWRKLIGLEMETYALYRSAFEAPRPKPLFASMKGVSDFAQRKDDRWREYAAWTAAEYAAFVIRKYWGRISSPHGR